MSIDASYSLSYAEINLTQLKMNIAEIERYVAPAIVLGIVKANAYGHGLLEVSTHLIQCGIRYLGVSSLEEGIELRQAGVSIPILTLNAPYSPYLPAYISNDLLITVSSTTLLEVIEDLARAMSTVAYIHLKIDTGMGDTGISVKDAGQLIEASMRCRHCIVKGVFSHFANSVDVQSMSIQYERFLEVLEIYERLSVPPPLRHVASSGAVLRFPQACLDMVRVGQLLYGLYPDGISEKAISIAPILSVKSKVICTTWIAANQRIGYGSTWKSAQSGKLAIVAIGFADGYPRALSNKAEVIIKRKRYKVVGIIAMNQLQVFVGQDDVAEGDDVILLGGKDDNRITCEELSALSGTFKTEVLCGLHPIMPRQCIIE